MIRMLTVSVMAMFVLSGTTPAISDEAAKKKCLASVETVKDMRKNSDSGQKELIMVDKLIGVSEGLCKDDAVDDAEELLSVARGIMGTE